MGSGPLITCSFLGYVTLFQHVYSGATGGTSGCQGFPRHNRAFLADISVICWISISFPQLPPAPPLAITLFLLLDLKACVSQHLLDSNVHGLPVELPTTAASHPTDSGRRIIITLFLCASGSTFRPFLCCFVNRYFVLSSDHHHPIASGNFKFNFAGVEYFSTYRCRVTTPGRRLFSLTVGTVFGDFTWFTPRTSRTFTTLNWFFLLFGDSLSAGFGGDPWPGASFTGFNKTLFQIGGVWLVTNKVPGIDILFGTTLTIFFSSGRRLWNKYSHRFYLPPPAAMIDLQSVKPLQAVNTGSPAILRRFVHCNILDRAGLQQLAFS